MLQTYWKYKGVTDIDLVCGGPPYGDIPALAIAGRSISDKKDIPSNHLFQEMVRVIRCLRPKIFLFENVRGLLNAKWTPEGHNGEIFKAVLAEFKTLQDYGIRWDLLHAKDYGVPQNRPRVIMVGIREDILPHWVQAELCEVSFDEPSAVETGFLPKPSGVPPTLVELLSDLEDPNYLNFEETSKYVHEPKTEIQKLLRTTRDGRVMGKGDKLTEQEYSNHCPTLTYVRNFLT